ncbi:MAG: HK97 gp10 family phage protein [Butyricicoccus sp.]|nr:HK97 gp10 family phage protein [Butyricicoccus sp.]
MARDGIDLSELMDFADRLDGAGQSMEKRERKFLQQQGNKLKRKTAQKARAEVRKTRVERADYTREAGTYHKSIKRGKVHTKDGAQRVRVYSSDPVGHLIEDGWTPKARDGSRGTKQPGKQVFDKAYEAYAPEYEADAEEMVDEMIDKI